MQLHSSSTPRHQETFKLDPSHLTEEQKRVRLSVQWCAYMLQKFDGGRSNRAWDIVGAIEKWMYRQFNP